MPLDKFGNRYEIIPADGSTKHTRSFTVKLNYRQEEPHGTTKSPCRPNTPVFDNKLKKTECDEEGSLNVSIVGCHGGVRATLAAAVKEKLQAFREAQLKAEAAVEKCQEGRVIHKGEAPDTCEEWFDKPGEVDTLGDIWIWEDVYGIGY